MAKREVTNRTVLIVLIGLAALATIAVKGELDKRKLVNNYAQAQATIQQLEDDWVRLNQELSEARQTVDSQSGDLAQLHTEFEELQARLAQTQEDIATLRIEYAQLQHANTELTGELATVTEQREALQAKLSSVRELKVALRDLRHKIWTQRWHAFAGQWRRPDSDMHVATGNRGYVVRDGASTLSAGTPAPRLQVRVLDPEAQ